MANRRDFLRNGLAAGIGLLAGCSSTSDLRSKVSSNEEQKKDEKATLVHESDATLSRSTPLSGWTEYGYDRQTTNGASGEHAPSGWVQPTWRDPVEGTGKTNEPLVPVPLEDYVLVETSRGNSVAALDAASGEKRWEFPLRGPRNGSMVGETAFLTGNTEVASVSIADGELAWKRSSEKKWFPSGARTTVVNGVAYVSGLSTTLMAYDAATGERLWSYGDIPTPGTPAVSDGSVYVAAGRTVHSVPATREKAEAEWTHQFVDSTTSEEFDQSVVVDASRGLVLVVSIDGTSLVALDAGSGDRVWEQDLSPAEIFGRLAIADGTAYLATTDGVRALEYKGGEPAESWVAGSGQTVMDAPTIVDDVVYATFEYGEVRAIDRTSGETNWRTYTVAGTMAQTSPAVHEGRLYVGTDQGTQAFEHRGPPGAADTGRWSSWRGSTARTGATDGTLPVSSKPDVQWATVARSRPSVPPVLADGVLVCGTAAITAIDAASGAPLWKARPGSGGIDGLAVNDGTVFFCADWDRTNNENVVQARDLLTGALEWEQSFPDGNGRMGIAVPPTNTDADFVFFKTGAGEILQLDVRNGEPLQQYSVGPHGFYFSYAPPFLVTGALMRSGKVRVWAVPSPYLGTIDLDGKMASPNPPILDENGMAYLSQLDGTIYSIDLYQQSIRWKQSPPIGDDGWIREGVLGDDRLYYADSQGGLTALERDGGAIAWHVKFDKLGGLVRSGDTLLCSVNDSLTAVDPTDGSTVWTVEPSTVKRHSPSGKSLSEIAGFALGSDGIYLASKSLTVKYG